MATIVIDPGHGGSATIPGDSTWNNAVGPNGTLEKTLTLAIGLKVDAVLRAAGHVCRLTRSTDVNLRLRDRAAVAKALSANVFVSIHLNGSTNHNAQGTETLVHITHSASSARLSLSVQDAVLGVTGLTDRNRTFDPATRIKPQSLGVLKPANHAGSTAACLVEVSFLDRADEEARLQNSAYRDNIAKAIATGIEHYLQNAGLAMTMAMAVDLGDAIEAEALADAGSVDPVAFLDLTAVPQDLGAGGQADDANESERIPPQPFSPAFVNGGFDLQSALAAGNNPDLSDFATFIAGLNLEHFQADEFLVMGGQNESGRCKGKNSPPPRNLWPNIANTAVMLDRIRSELGAPIRILSCYRAEPYNTCIGGESRSLHMDFKAIDFTCRVGTPEIWRRVAARIRASEARFRGGIGVYPSSNFVHIDTRGTNADWRG